MTIFERLDALEATVNGLNTDINNLRTHLTSVEETVEEMINAQEDTGWIALSLVEGVSAQNSTTYPCRYRKIGKRVYVEGCVTGFAEVEKVVATLPEGFRPSKEFYYQCVAPAGKTDTFRFFKDGRIQRMATTTPSPAASNYHFIQISYFVD